MSTEDLKTTITQDNAKVNFLAIAFVFCILLVNFKSPVPAGYFDAGYRILHLDQPGESLYFRDRHCFYIGYLIISTVQLGLPSIMPSCFPDRYMDFQENTSQKKGSGVYDLSGPVPYLFLRPPPYSLWQE